MTTKTILGAALLGLLAAACGGEDEQMAAQTPAPSATAPEPPPPAPVVETPPPKPTMLETQLAFEKIYGASLGDPDKIIPFFAPDAVMWNIGEPEIKGREAILKTMRDIDNHVTDFKGATSRMWIKGNTLVLDYVSTATDKASGKQASLSGCEIFTFNDDGLIVTDHAYGDAETIMKQIGAYKGQKPAAALLPLPTGPVETHSAKNDATEESNAKAIVATNALWFKKDDKGFFGFIDDGVSTYDMAENGLVAHDKKFNLASVAAARKSYDFTAWKDVNVIAVDDFTIDEQEVSLTQKAHYSFDHVHEPNTKKSATVHGVEIDRWKDGKIVKSWTWANSLELDTQLGTGPAAPPKPAAKTAKAITKK